MFELQLSEFNQQEFLASYWQQKPVVIRQGFKNFKDPISADEIAGLACEEEVESRLVFQEKGKWQAAFGPFESYEHLGDNNWSLIVQALDHWSEEAAKMIEPFRFIPHWRLDDLMVSFATPGGGVGPHIDLYDVFICQGSGKRNWRVGHKGEHREFAAHEALLHVDPFESIIDVELLPGDILYIPPGFPHEGITLETSLSFSVGFRTNSSTHLLSAFADHLIDNELGAELIEDPQRIAVTQSGEINNKDYALIKKQFQSLLDNEQLFKNFTGSYLTQAKHELDLQTPDEAFAREDVSEILASNNLMKLGGLRAFYFTETINAGLCFIDGNEFLFDPSIAEAIKLLCNNVELSPKDLTIWRNNNLFLEFITEKINSGYWYFS